MATESTAPTRIVRFGTFEVDLSRRELRKSGVRIKLHGQPFEVLAMLLERPGETVPREVAQQRLWPTDTFVDFDHGVNTAINRLREALGDSAENPRFIETLPKRGYRFIAPIEVPAAIVAAVPAQVVTVPASPVPVIPDPPQPAKPVHHQLSVHSRVVFLLAFGALCIAVVVAALYLRVGRPATVGAPRTTLAVLPFQNLSNDAEQEFFSDGFTEEMIAELGTLDPAHLGVIARTTTMLYKNARKDVGQIRKDLGVDYVLEGSIRRAGSRMRITAQLVQTTDMTNLWAESYDRDVSDALAIQREVAMKIAHSLTLALRHPPADRRSTSASFPAYEL